MGKKIKVWKKGVGERGRDRKREEEKEREIKNMPQFTYIFQRGQCYKPFFLLCYL